MKTNNASLTDIEAEGIAWRLFAKIYPHEAYATWPDRFWNFFRTRCPNLNRKQMEQILIETGKDECLT